MAAGAGIEQHPKRLRLFVGSRKGGEAPRLAEGAAAIAHECEGVRAAGFEVRGVELPKFGPACRSFARLPSCCRRAAPAPPSAGNGRTPSPERGCRSPSAGDAARAQRPIEATTARLAPTRHGEAPTGRTSRRLPQSLTRVGNRDDRSHAFDPP